MAEGTKRLLNLLLVLGVMVAVLSIWIGLNHVRTTWAWDLRGRVVGSRLLMLGQDPYTTKWKPGDSDRLLHPWVNVNQPVSEVTVPPTMLVLHAPLANMWYPRQIAVWYVIQWALFFLTLALFASLANSAARAKAVWIVGLIGFSGINFWRLHLERGQHYILYPCLVALACWICYRRFKWNTVLGSFVLGLTASLRPPLVLMLMPMLIFRQWKMFFGGIAGLLAGVLFTLPYGGVKLWQSYLASSSIRGKQQTFELVWLHENSPLPSVIEGIKVGGRVWADVTFRDLNASIQGVLYCFYRIRVPDKLLKVGVILVLAGLLFALYRARGKNPVSPALIILAGIGLTLAAEPFIPAHSWSYNNIQWLIPLMFVLILAKNPLVLISWRTLCASFALYFCTLTWFEMGFFYSDIAMAVFSVAMALQFLKQPADLRPLEKFSSSRENS